MGDARRTTQEGAGEQALRAFGQGRWRGVSRAGWLERIDLDDPVGWARGCGGQVVRDRATARTVRVGVDDEVVFVKHMIGPKDGTRGLRGCFYQWRWRLGPARVFRLVRVTRQMNARGIATPTILLAASCGGAQRAEVLVTRQSRGLILRRALKRSSDAHERAGMLRAVGRVVAKLHDAGGVHGDLVPANVLIDPPTGRCTLLDNDRTCVRAWSARSGCRRRNLAQLLFRLLPYTNAAERRVLMDAYFESSAWGCGRDRVWNRRQRRLILQAGRRRRVRVEGKTGMHDQS